jgi:hypothetical protein
VVVVGAGIVERSSALCITILLRESRLLRPRKPIQTVVLRRRDFPGKLTALEVIIVIVLKDGNLRLVKGKN